MTQGAKMARKSLISSAELHRMAKVAKQFGVVIEQEFEGVIIRVGPPHGSPVSEAATLNEWDEVFDRPPEPIQPPFDHRELHAMERLADLGVGHKIHSCTIRSFGPHTQAKLVDRGYVVVIHQSGKKFKDDEISITKKGLSDWEALKRYQGKHQYF